jgi:hypothetical protein
LAEYALLWEHEFLLDAKEMDARFHLAKLIGQMMTNEGAELAWREHQEYRNGLLSAAAPAPTSQENLMDAVARIHRKMQKSGLLTNHSGAVN